MPESRLDQETLEEALVLVKEHGSKRAAHKNSGIPRETIRSRFNTALTDPRTRKLAKELFPVEFENENPTFEVDPLPQEDFSAEELLELRKHQFAKRIRAHKARKLIPVRIKIDGPIGIAHFGDPHVDDDGCDIIRLERDVKLVRDTEGMFGGNVGDLQNNWVGRLARLYAHQSTTDKQAWTLTEWLVNAISWLYLVKGNHDCWTGSGDPLDWMMRNQSGTMQDHGARLNLIFPNKKEVRINARHDFTGHSMWNEVHGPKKAAKMGWRDHVLTCGHKHTSGYALEKCPASGLISHIMRVAGYKIIDGYADEKGLPDQNIFPTAVTIINPEYADDDPKLVHTVFDMEEGADYLNWKRSKWELGKRAS